MANKKETNLLVAVSNKLEELFNDCYFDLVGDIERKNKMYKFSTMFDYNFDSFNQFDSDGKLIVNKYNFADDYIPVAVEGLIGDLEPIPNTYIANVNIPLTMVVNLEKVDLTVQVIQQFITKVIGQLYELDYEDANHSTTYKLAFMSELPDLSSFSIVQGEETKEVTIEISGVISDKVYWGNNIKYRISTNGNVNENYIDIFKIDPASSKEVDTYTNQIIGQDYSKSSERSASWQKTITILAGNNSVTKELIKFIDFGYDAWGVTKPDWWLEITYLDILGTPVTKAKPVEITSASYEDSIGNFVSINFTMVDRL